MRNSVAPNGSKVMSSIGSVDDTFTGLVGGAAADPRS